MLDPMSRALGLGAAVDKANKKALAKTPIWKAVIFKADEGDAEPFPDSPPVPESLKDKVQAGFLSGKRRFVGAFKEDPNASTEEQIAARKAWRQAIVRNGEGTYEIYQFLDEACTRCAGIPTVGVMFVGEEDVEAARVAPDEPPPPLSDEELDRLIARAISGDMAAVEFALASLHAHDCDKKRIKRFRTEVSDALHDDEAVWGKAYLPEKRAARNVSRRLTQGGGLFSTVDRGEWDDKPCEECGATPSLPDDASIAAIRLCARHQSLGFEAKRALLDKKMKSLPSFRSFKSKDEGKS